MKTKSKKKVCSEEFRSLFLIRLGSTANKRKEEKFRMKMYVDETVIHVDDIFLNVHNEVTDFYFHKLDLNLFVILQEYFSNDLFHELHNLHLDIDIIVYQYYSH